MNCGVSSCGLSALTSATFPKSPNMLRWSSCLSGNSWSKIHTIRRQLCDYTVEKSKDNCHKSKTHTHTHTPSMDSPVDTPETDSCPDSWGTSGSCRASHQWCSTKRSRKTPSPGHTEGKHENPLTFDSNNIWWLFDFSYTWKSVFIWNSIDRHRRGGRIRGKWNATKVDCPRVEPLTYVCA